MSLLFEAIEHFEHLFIRFDALFILGDVDELFELVDVLSAICCHDDFGDRLRNVLNVGFVRQLCIENSSNLLLGDKVTIGLRSGAHLLLMSELHLVTQLNKLSQGRTYNTLHVYPVTLCI